MKMANNQAVIIAGIVGLGALGFYFMNKDSGGTLSNTGGGGYTSGSGGSGTGGGVGGGLGK